MRYSWKVDDFDSEIFGFKVAKIESIESKDSIDSLVKELIDNGIEYATYRIASNNISLIQSLQEFNFVVVDGIISLELDMTTAVEEPAIGEIREVRSDDLEKLKSLTRGLYLLSRIYMDPAVQVHKADNFFMKWIENSINGTMADSVLVWEEKGKILGYITLQKKGQVPLVGVSPEARGKGIAKKLLKESFRKFKKWKVEKVIIETQISNIPALRVDLDCGFKPINSFLTLRWLNND